MALLRWMMPDFVGIGAMRAGTTWLSNHLRRHPQIWAGKKELHFFDQELETRVIPLVQTEFEAKLRYGIKFVPGKFERKLTGEFTPAYAVLDREAIARIHSWLPQVKLLFIMRDPVERAWSHARKDFPKKKGKLVTAASESELREFLDGPFTRRRSDYAWTLENWLTYYSRDQFFITYFNGVKTDPSGLLREVFQFLGVDPEVSLDAKEVANRMNSQPEVPMPEWVRVYLGDRFYKDADKIEDLCGQKAPWGAS